MIERCGARGKRSGLPCMHYPMKGRKRCRLHGGTNTVDHTPHNPNPWPGKRAQMAQAAFRRAMGIPPPQLANFQKRPDKPDVRILKERVVADIDWFEEKAREQGLVPQRNAVAVRPTAELTMPELLGEVGALAFGKLRDLLMKDRELRHPETGEIIKPMDVRVERFEADLALGSAKLFARVAESSLRGQQNDKLQEILDAINSAEIEG